MKRGIKITALVLALALALFTLASIVYFIVLNYRWSACTNDLAVSFSNSSTMYVTYRGEKIRIEKEFEKTNLFRELTSGGAVDFQKKPASNDILEFSFSDGSHLTASRKGENQVRIYYVRKDGRAYGFTISDSTSFRNLATIALRNRTQ